MTPRACGDDSRYTGAVFDLISVSFLPVSDIRFGLLETLFHKF